MKMHCQLCQWYMLLMPRKLSAYDIFIRSGLTRLTIFQTLIITSSGNCQRLLHGFHYMRKDPQYEIRSSDNDSTGFWPPGSLHTLGADGHINKEIGFLWGLKFFALNILRRIPTIESTFDVANMVKTATVKDVPINNDALLNIQAC